MIIVADAAQQLVDAIPALLDRGLYDAARWASDLLASSCPTKTPKPVSNPEGGEGDEFVAIAMAKSLFGLRQYRRAANALKTCSSPLAVFIRSYSRFLSGEKWKQDQDIELKEQNDRSQVSNPELAGLKEDLSVLYRCGDLDAHGLFLYGLVLKHLDSASDARTVLLESVALFPCNWSAWKTLSSLVTDVKILQSLPLKETWMTQFFLADVFVELHATTEAFRVLQDISEQFPSNPFVRAQLALAHYNERDYDQAQNLLEALRVSDPDCLDHMDTYSNILFVKENKAALSFLAHNAVKVDKYCPETCCIIGNYYSLKCDHEKAVLYFQRALRLSPSYLSAWTLMGHEYVELRNTSAAINAYRRAVKIDARDYRAWYGLGQAYELLQMHTFALYYFGKATEVRPFDPRMWCAMADAYEKLDLIDDAIRCFRRAESNDDREGVAVAKLAKLYAATNEIKKAIYYYKKLLTKFDEQHPRSSGDPDAATVSGASLSADAVAALLFLTHHYKSVGKLADAEQCCRRLLDSSANDEARALQKEIRQLLSSRTPTRLAHPPWPSSDDTDMCISP